MTLANQPFTDALLGSADTDARLMATAATCGRTFTSLVTRYRQPLLTYFYRQGAQTESEDLVQETFIRLHRYRNRYRPDAKFSSFLFTLAHHAWLDHGRRAQRRSRAYLSYEDECARQMIPDEGPESDVDIEAALSFLSAKHRRVIELYFYQGLRLHEIACSLGIPVGTVKSRLNHALRGLREAVGLGTAMCS